MRKFLSQLLTWLLPKPKTEQDWTLTRMHKLLTGETLEERRARQAREQATNLQ